MKTSQRSELLAARWDRLWVRLSQVGLDGLVITGSSDMEYLTGYRAMSLERITALIAVAPDDPSSRPQPLLLAPELEKLKVEVLKDVFDLEGWGDTDNPVERIVEALDQSKRIAVSDNMWATHLLALQGLSGAEISSIGSALSGLRSIKSPAERHAMRAVGGLADKVSTALQQGHIPLVGRREDEVAADIKAMLLDVGHETVEFVIVASGPNSASPHHRPGARVIKADEMVLCDFGGKSEGYCSDTTRCVFTGPIPEDVADAYAVLLEAQAAAVVAAQPGAELAEVDRAARSVISHAGYGEYFVHRTGHGIGVQVHEEPYVTGKATETIEVGHVFSVEPGIYIPQRWGIRLEDIIVVEETGPIRCNNSDHNLFGVAE